MSGFPERDSSDSALVTFLALALVWGSSFVAIEVAVEHAPPLLLAGLRYVVAGTVVFGYAAITTDRILPRTRGDFGAVLAAAVFTIAGYQAFLFVGTQYVSGSVASVVISLSPILTAVLAGALLEESSDATDVLGFLLGIVGVALVARPDPTAVDGTTVGVGLVFLGALSFSLGAVGTRSFDPSLPIPALQSWAMAGGAVLLLGGAGVRGESLPSLASVPTVALAAFAYVALVSGALGYVLYFSLLDATGATDTALVSYFEPVVATLVAAAALGHAVTLPTIAGFGVVLSGFAVVRRQQLRQVGQNLRRTLAETVR